MAKNEPTLGARSALVRAGPVPARKGSRYPQRKNIRFPHEHYRDGYAFFITINTRNRHRRFLNEALTAACTEILLQCSQSATVYAWCFMPDHFHALLQPEDLIAWVRGFKSRTSVAAKRFGVVRSLWQRSFYDHALRREEALHDVARYIWENPVRAELIEHASNYLWAGSIEWPRWRAHDFE